MYLYTDRVYNHKIDDYIKDLKLTMFTVQLYNIRNPDNDENFHQFSRFTRL